MIIAQYYDSCTVKMETNYGGHNVNNGNNDQKILYLGSCQSFCESKYPTSTHYSYATPRNADSHNTCWCKRSNAGAVTSVGVIAGDTSCPGALMQLMHVIFWKGNICLFVSVEGAWASWESWEACSVTCGQGTRTRVRHHTGGRRPCQGEPRESASCQGEKNEAKNL